MTTVVSVATPRQQYYQRNRQRILAEQRERYANDPEFRAKNLERARRWRQADPERTKARARVAARRRRSKDPEQTRAKARERYRLWCVSDPERHKRKLREATNNRLRRQYNLTLRQFDVLWHKQEGRCALCREHMQRCGKMTADHVVIDHCHKTKRVRGLIHNRCNRLLGHAYDSLKLLKQAVSYLQKVSEKTEV